MGKWLTGAAGSGGLGALLATGGWIAVVVGAALLTVVVGVVSLVVYVVLRQGTDEPYVRLRELIVAWRGTAARPTSPDPHPGPGAVQG